MNLFSPPALFVLLSSILLVSACQKKPTADQTGIQRIEIDTLHTFTTFEEHNIAQPFSINILENGTIAVVDFGQKSVSLLEKNGELITAFGREGRGPGEFIRISNMIETNGVLNITDSDLALVSRYDTEGNYISSYPFKSSGILNDITLIKDSVYVASTGGDDGSLLAITDLRTDSTIKFGISKTESIATIDFQKSLTQLKNGEIPDFFKNMVTLRSNNENIYAFLNSYSELHKYDSSGKLLWQKELPLPYNQEIFERTVEQAKNSPGGIPAFNYITDFKVVDGEVYILTNRRNQDDSQLLIRVTEDENITHIYTLPASVGYLSSFDLLQADGTIYLTSSHDGFVYKGSIPL